MSNNLNNTPTKEGKLSYASNENGQLCKNKNRTIMIHYNPDKHHDKLVNHIAEAYLTGAELDQSLMPHKNNGEPSYALCDRKTSTEVVSFHVEILRVY